MHAKMVTRSQMVIIVNMPHGKKKATVAAGRLADRGEVVSVGGPRQQPVNPTTADPCQSTRQMIKCIAESQ